VHPKNLLIADYTYELPEDRIAHFPKEERDQSRLLIYDQGQISEDIYKNIATQLPAGSLMVFNQTRVVHVRLLFRKPTGGQIEVFCLEPDSRYADMQTAMTQCGEVYWQCLVGGANKWKDGTILQLAIPELNTTLHAAMVTRGEGVFLLRLYWDDASLSFAHILQAAGKVPLPPYMNRDMTLEDKERYQTIFAREEGSVAAPTAGLHFTQHIFDTLAAQQIQSAYITLHVGAGTFKQVKSEQIAGHEMHAEWIEVQQSFIEQLLANGQHITAVGTTSARTLESLYWLGLKLHLGQEIDWSGIAVAQWDPYELEARISTADALTQLLNWMRAQNLQKLITRTQILIAPGYQCRVIHALVTNFHQPGSTLLLLIAALVGDDWRKMYAYALENGFRFLSYGDGCLIRHIR
jgi:S-adenosylmethionine:tRNA ribosyltransferase-isomerase